MRGTQDQIYRKRDISLNNLPTDSELTLNYIQKLEQRLFTLEQINDSNRNSFSIENRVSNLENKVATIDKKLDLFYKDISNEVNKIVQNLQQLNINTNSIIQKNQQQPRENLPLPITRDSSATKLLDFDYTNQNIKINGNQSNDYEKCIDRGILKTTNTRYKFREDSSGEKLSPQKQLEETHSSNVTGYLNSYKPNYTNNGLRNKNQDQQSNTKRFRENSFNQIYENIIPLEADFGQNIQNDKLNYYTKNYQISGTLANSEIFQKLNEEQTYNSYGQNKFDEQEFNLQKFNIKSRQSTSPLKLIENSQDFGDRKRQIDQEIDKRIKVEQNKRNRMGFEVAGQGISDDKSNLQIYQVSSYCETLKNDSEKPYVRDISPQTRTNYERRLIK